MPTGETITGSLSDSLDEIVASARNVREFKGVMSQLVEKHTLQEGTGLSWKEVSIDQLTAQAVTETTVMDNPQQYVDTPFSITPTVIGVHTFITDRVRARMNKTAFAKVGSQVGNAIMRKKDEDGLVVLDGATTSLGGAGTTMVSGLVAAATARMQGNSTEPIPGPYRSVLHPFHIKALYDELVAGVGTDVVSAGPTADVFKAGFKLPIAGAEVFPDGNISIDGNDDAKGGVFAKEGIVLIQGRAMRRETRREPHIGGGGDSLWVYDEYAYGERLFGGSSQASVGVYEILADATAPTS